MTKLTANQLAVMSAVLGVSNSGQDHLFCGRGPRNGDTITPERLAAMFTGGRFSPDVDSITTMIVAGLCENDQMLDMFQEETRDWVPRLKKMSVEKIKETWPEYAAYVECVT